MSSNSTHELFSIISVMRFCSPQTNHLPTGIHIHYSSVGTSNSRKKIVELDIKKAKRGKREKKGVVQSWDEDDKVESIYKSSEVSSNNEGQNRCFILTSGWHGHFYLFKLLTSNLNCLAKCTRTAKAIDIHHQLQPLSVNSTNSMARDSLRHNSLQYNIIEMS